jgi:hypothetical protein
VVLGLSAHHSALNYYYLLTGIYFWLEKGHFYLFGKGRLFVESVSVKKILQRMKMKCTGMTGQHRAMAAIALDALFAGQDGKSRAIKAIATDALFVGHEGKSRAQCQHPLKNG